MNVKKIFFCFLGIVLGEITLILCTTIAQEVIFNGVSYYSTTPVIIFGGFLTFLAAIIAGYVARLVGKRYAIIIPSIISTLIIMETAFLIFSGVTQGPVWFDVIAGFSLVLGIWIGYHYHEIKDSFGNQKYYPDPL